MKVLIDNEIATTKASMTNERIDEGAFCDYNDASYICDAIMEISDNNVDIYTADLFEWASRNYDVIEDANEELGTPSDMLQQIRQGQYIANEREIYDNLHDMLYIYCLDLLRAEGIEELDEQKLQDLYEFADQDHNEYLPSLADVLEVVNEEQEED